MHIWCRLTIDENTPPIVNTNSRIRRHIRNSRETKSAQAYTHAHAHTRTRTHTHTHTHKREQENRLNLLMWKYYRDIRLLGMVDGGEESERVGVILDSGTRGRVSTAWLRQRLLRRRRGAGVCGIANVSDGGGGGTSCNPAAVEVFLFRSGHDLRHDVVVGPIAESPCSVRSRGDFGWFRGLEIETNIVICSFD